MSRRRKLALALSVVLALGLTAGPASANSPGPVTANPPNTTPQLATSGTDGSIEVVRQIVPCGGTMYAVGQFNQMKRFTTVYNRNNAFSFSATTGEVTSWNPNVNGRVETVAFNGTDCSYAYLGGQFTSVNGAVVKNIARVSTTTGAVDAAFKNTAGGRVNHMEVMKGHLLVGGYFPGYLKSFNPATGLDDGYAMPAISGNYVFPGVKQNATRVWNMTPSPDGNAVLIMGVFTNVGGLARRQIFRLNLGVTATVSNWYSDGNPANPKYLDGFDEDCATVEPFWLQDASWAPDMSKIYVATTGYKPWDRSAGGFPREELCDAAAGFPATEADVDPLWINYTGCDSLYSTAADEHTVYVGGHQRWMNSPLGCDGQGVVGTPSPGLSGLDPTNGALIFNPTKGRGLGATDMLVTPAGLWIASDNQSNVNQCAGKYGHAGICFLPY